ncbi:MAG: peptidoglycan DD-metalloendopeptidase family protein [Oscillospiraceae bacterium]
MENNSKESKTNRMFFIAVTISLLMIIVACIVAYPQAIPPEVSDLAEVTETTTEDQSTPNDDLTPVENIETNVPKVTTQSTLDTTINITSQSEVTTQENVIITTNPPAPIVDDNVPKMPVSGEIINEFSNGELVKSATSGIWQTHNGIDIATDTTTPIEAVQDGTVIKVYEDALLGICVTIDHTDFIANYCNLNKVVLVSEGDKVTTGDIIGNVGNTAVSETVLDSHLHFEILKGGKYVNPLDVIKH